MMGALTYGELLYPPDLADAVRELTDADLCLVLERLQSGEEKGWPARRVLGVCIIEAERRFRAIKRGATNPTSPRLRRTGGHEGTRMGEMTIRVNVDFGHGSEVAE